MPAAAVAAVAFLLSRSRGLLSYLAANPGSLGPQTAAALLRHALDLALVSVGCAGAAALGRRALRAARPPAGEPAWLDWLAGLVVGEAALSLALWALVALGACRAGPCAALWASLAAAAWRDRRALRALIPPGPRGFTATLAAAVLAAALLRGAAAAGAPPTDWDTLANHLAAPKLYLARGAFFRLPWMLGAHYPLNAEMHYAGLLALRGDEAAQWLGWLHGALLAAAAGGWAAALAGAAAAWPAAAFVAAAPPMARVLGTGKNDLQASLAIFAALLAGAAAARRKDERAWLLAGLVAGAAAGFKLNALWAAAALGALAASAAWRERRAAPLAAYLAGALALGLPWYLRDWAWTGNPFWPMLGGSLGDAAGAAAFARLQASVTVGLRPSLKHAALLPYALLAEPALFLDPPRELLAAAALACAAGWAHARRLLPRAALVFAGIYAGCWFFVCQEGRLLLPLTPLAAALIAGVCAREAAAPWRRLACAAAVALSLSPAALLSPNNELFGFLALSPRRDAADARDRYLLHALGAPYALARATSALPKDAVVLLYRDPRGYYVERPWRSGEPIAVGYEDVSDAQALRARLGAQGVTHVLYNPTLGPIAGDRAYYERVDALFRALLADARLESAAGPLALYALARGR